MTLLVELAVVRKIGLRDDGKCAASVNCNRAIVEGCSLAQGRADDEGGQDLGAGRADGLDGGEDLVQQWPWSSAEWGQMKSAEELMNLLRLLRQ